MILVEWILILKTYFESLTIVLYNVLIEAIFHVPKTVYVIICKQSNIKNPIFSFIDVSDGEKNVLKIVLTITL